MSSERLLWRVRGSQRRPPAMGGYLPLATGVSTVRYPIPQRTFKYVATVQRVTDETCQFRTTRLPFDRPKIRIIRRHWRITMHRK